MKIPKFKELSDNLQLLIKTSIAVSLIFGAVITGIKRGDKHITFIKEGPALIDSLDRENKYLIDSLQMQVYELRTAVFVLAGALSDNMPYVDSCTYYIKGENGEEVIGYIKRALSYDLYIFVPDDIVGERPYLIGRHLGKSRYHFFDFSGKYVPVYKKE